MKKALEKARMYFVFIYRKKKYVFLTVAACHNYMWDILHSIENWYKNFGGVVKHRIIMHAARNTCRISQKTSNHKSNLFEV